jgi:formylglycine-generating enzyme required for sulfatase activity
MRDLPLSHVSTRANSIGSTFVRIPAGMFLMGSSPDDDEALSCEKPQHQVTISKPFELAIHTVTQGQYRAVTGQSPSHFDGDDWRPVEKVSWFDAVEFCNAFSRKEQRTPFYEIRDAKPYPMVTVPNWNANGYRLPTEAEWEYACRAGSEMPYPFLFETAPGKCAWISGYAGGKTHPVGLNEPNSFGLYDMLGNVYQWCWDVYGQYQSSHAVDPCGPSQDTERNERVNRGTCCYSSSEHCRSAYRGPSGGHLAHTRHNTLGFRLAAALSGS